MNIIGPTNDGLSFAKAAGINNYGTKPTTDLTTIQCYSCKKMGHKSYECPSPKAPPENAAVTAPKETTVNHVHIGNDASSDSDGDDDDDDDNSNLELSF